MKLRLPLLLLLLILASCSRPPAAGTGPLLDNDRWILINYWAIWCNPCREEMPELNEFVHQQRERLDGYAVNFDGVTGEELAVQATDLNIEFTLLEEDPSSKLGYARPTVLPTTLLIDPAGKLKARLLGPQTAESLREAIK